MSFTVSPSLKFADLSLSLGTVSAGSIASSFNAYAKVAWGVSYLTFASS